METVTRKGTRTAGVNKCKEGDNVENMKTSTPSSDFVNTLQMFFFVFF